VQNDDGKLRIFISWSGDLSNEVAQQLKIFLQRVISGSVVWLSSEDISAGAFWHREIMTGLEDSRVGLIVLTRENVAKPWLHYEAGYLSKYINDGLGLVAPVLVRVSTSEIVGPMTSLQSVELAEGPMYKLMQDINGKHSTPADSAVLKDLFEAFWPALMGKTDDAVGAHRTKVNLVKPFNNERTLTEILDTVRGLARAAESPEANRVGSGATERQMLNLIRTAIKSGLTSAEISKLMDMAVQNYPDAEGMLARLRATPMPGKSVGNIDNRHLIHLDDKPEPIHSAGDA
jgi:hypothetical protein